MFMPFQIDHYTGKINDLQEALTEKTNEVWHYDMFISLVDVKIAYK